MKWSILIVLLVLGGCHKETSDDKQREQQEKMLMEATQQTGMPAITNFRERKIVKDLIELRDKEGLVTWTYIWSAFQGKFVLLGQSVGYGIPAATQYTNPMKAEYYSSGGRVVIPQADPNGLFSPSSVEATWVLLVNPKSKKVEPQYIEERIAVFTFELPDRLVMNGRTPPAEIEPPGSDPPAHE